MTKKQSQVRISETVSKPCKCCGKNKPISEFYKDKSQHDNLTRNCKECCKNYSKTKTTTKHLSVSKEQAQSAVLHRCDTCNEILSQNDIENGYMATCLTCSVEKALQGSECHRGESLPRVFYEGSKTLLWYTSNVSDGSKGFEFQAELISSELPTPVKGCGLR